MIRTRNTTRIIFLLYGAALVWVVLFKMTFSFESIAGMEGIRTINWEPFRYSIIGGDHLTREATLNILIFLPLGVFLPMLGVSGVKSVVYGLLTSAAFEAVQYAFAIGVTDITDVITNTVGVILGACLYGILALLFRNKKRRHRLINTLALLGGLAFAAVAVHQFLMTR